MRASNWRRWAAVLGLAVAMALVFTWWFLARCEGHWQGVPIESQRASELTKIERDLRADVLHLSVDIGERNLRDDLRYRALQRASAWIRERWESQGYEVREQAFSVQGRSVSNLEIEIAGHHLPREIVVVSAQHDTLPGSPGANNNASGEAVLLQLSAMLRGTQPDRTIRLISFTTEEDPWFGTDDMGSRHYARRCRERREDVHAMLALDSMGYFRQEPHTQRLPFPFSALYPDRGNFLAFIGNIRCRPPVVTATRGFHKGSEFPIEAGLAPEWVEGVTWSDHSSFWRYGYPGIQVTDTGGFRSPHHTLPSDTPEKLDYRALARVTFGLFGAVLELATEER